MTPDANDLCVFAVKRGYIESKEIYCNPLYPTYLSLVEKYQHSPYANAYTDSLLCYSDYCIDFLKAKNTPINEDFSLHPQFESPTFDYYENVKDFMTEEKWTGLGTPLLSMLAAESNEIVRSHFFSYNDHYYPLFPLQ